MGVTYDPLLDALRTTDPGDPQHYRHDQGTPLAMWTVVHNLGFQPAGIYVEDSAGSHHEPSVTQIDLNTLTLTFIGASDGFALVS